MIGLPIALLAGIFFLRENLAPANPTLTGIALVMVAAAAMSRGIPRVSVRDCWPYILYVAALTLSLLGSRTAASLAECARQVLFLGVIFAVARIATTERSQRIIVAATFIFAMAIIAQALLFAWQSEQPDRVVLYPIVEQWSGYPELGLLAAIFASGALALAAFGASLPLRAGAAYLSLFFTAGAVFLYSRSAWLTIALMAVWIAALAIWRRRGLRAVVILAVAAMGAVGALRLASVRPSLRLDSLAAVLSAPQTEDRLLGWRTGLAMIRDHPWLGIGPGMYRATYARYQGAAAMARNRAPGELERDRTHAYNLTLHVGAELGLVGMVAYLLMWGRILCLGLLAGSGGPQGLALALHAMLAAFFIRSQSEHFLANLQTSHRLLLLLAVLFGLMEAVRLGAAQSTSRR